MKYLLWAMVMWSGCSAPASGNRLDIEVTNASDRPVRMRVGAGIFTREIVLQPGQTGVYWLDRRWPVSRAEIEIK